MKEISAGVEKEGKHNSGKNTKQAYSETEMTVSCFAARSSRLQQIHRSRFIFLHFDSVMFGPTGILTCWVKKLFHHYVEYVFTLKCSLARMNQGHILNQAWSKNIYIYISIKRSPAGTEQVHRSKSIEMLFIIQSSVSLADFIHLCLTRTRISWFIFFGILNQAALTPRPSSVQLSIHFLSLLLLLQTEVWSSQLLRQLRGETKREIKPEPKLTLLIVKPRHYKHLSIFHLSSLQLPL